MCYCADKPVIDTQTDGHTDAGNDNTRRPKLASGKNDFINFTKKGQKAHPLGQNAHPRYINPPQW